MDELWTPNREQLKTMTDALMVQRMGEDWRTCWDPTEEQYRLKAMVDMEAGTFLMTAGELPTDGGAALRQQPCIAMPGGRRCWMRVGNC